MVTKKWLLQHLLNSVCLRAGEGEGVSEDGCRGAPATGIPWVSDDCN